MPRRVFGGEQLALDAARLLDQDRAAPPEARPSLMDAVRTFSDYVEARARLGWTDTMIAALLTEAGYPISAATLRSYRKRLREAQGGVVQPSGADPPRPAAMPVADSVTVIERPTLAPTSPPQAISEAAQRQTPKPTPAPSPVRPIPAKAVSTGVAPKPRTFSVSGTNLPPDRA